MRQTVIALAVALSTTGAFADSAERPADTGQYLYTLGFYHAPDDDRDADDGAGFGVGYGWRWTTHLFWEAQGFGAALDTDQADRTDFYQYGAGLDLMYEFSPGNFTPFALVGLGGVYNDVIPNSDDDFTAYGNAGIGLLSAPLANGLRVRLDARYIYDTFEFGDNDGMSDWRVGLGVQIPLGQRTVEKEVVREKVVTKEVAAPIVDGDGDGVPDQNDECPGTLEGLATDARGCVSKERQIVRLDNVNFEFDSARLRPSSRETLDQVVDSLRGDPELRVEIAGHTDSVGTEAYNQGLSERRAQAVRAYLVREGIDPDRVRARGYGESQPVASNETPEGQAQNRRVEFRVLE